MDIISHYKMRLVSSETHRTEKNKTWEKRLGGGGGRGHGSLPGGVKAELALCMQGKGQGMEMQAALTPTAHSSPLLRARLEILGGQPVALCPCTDTRMPAKWQGSTVWQLTELESPRLSGYASLTTNHFGP